MKKEIPMLFSTPMVQAILNGTKTETRRIVKYKKEIKNPLIGFTAFTPEGHFSVRGKHENGEYGESFFKNKYGNTGDLIWVRETWQKSGWDGGELVSPAFLASGHKACGWKPNIHMFKNDARIWLQNEGVHVERLHDINAEGALAEGIIRWHSALFSEERYKGYMDNDEWRDPVSSYRSLWESINGPGSWEANPWVWVVKFKVLSVNGKPNI